MRCKNFILFIALSLLISGLMPLNAFGEVVYEQKLEEAIINTKELFNISDDYDGFNSHVNSNGNKSYFYLNWTDSTNKLDNISVNTDALGNIISYNKYKSIYIEPDSKLPKIDKEEALKVALEFINKVDPELFNEIELLGNITPINHWDTEYNFRFIRLVNGIPYPDNNAYINVNKFTGDITNYNTNWDRDLSFPNPDNILSLEKGKESYKDKIGLNLIYKKSHGIYRDIDLNNNTSYFITYSPLDSRKAIDAISGEVLNLNYYGVMYSNEKTMDSSEPRAVAITPEERAEIEKLSGIKSIDEVEKVAREILKLDKDYIIQNRNLYSSWKNPGEYQWSLYFIKKLDNNKALTADISLDAKSLELISFYKYNEYNPDAKAILTKSESLSIAKEYIKKINPDKSTEVKYIEDISSKDGELSYYFRFIRVSDDIYVETDSISIGVDAVNEIISQYNIDWFKGDLPPKGSLIGYDKAYEVLFNNVGYELTYATLYDYDKPEDQNKEIKLVYSLNTKKPAIISANTGELLDASGNIYKESKLIQYTDITKSYAKSKVETLAEYGIGFNNEKFMPKDKIKQRDFLFLLWKATNYYRNETEIDIENIYTELTRSNIIKEGEKNFERIVTKEEAVKFVIRAKNYEKVAEIPNIYGDIFKDSKDIEPNLKGYINIAYGLKLINGDGSGSILPKNELKREDAASIIYNYIFN